jgi:inner membrane protein
VLLAPLWALALAWILAKLLREPGGWRALYGIVVMALYAHIAGDVITSFGTIVLAPFSDWRAAIGTTFIIDLWFTGIIVAGLLASAALYRSRIPAMVAGVVLAGYVGYQYLQRQDALEFGERYARTRGLQSARIEAHPRPVSPFNWTVFVSTPAEHHYAHVNVKRTTARRYQAGEGFVARLDAPYQPLALARWQRRSRFGESKEIEAAWNSPALAVFRWFADLPAYDGRSAGSTCVWFVDLRFLTPGREGMPFRYGACQEAPGAPWRLAIS